MKNTARHNRKANRTAPRKSSTPKPASGAHRFTEARGKTVDFVEFYTDAGFHCVEIGFDDRTAINFTIEPMFTVETGYSDWKTGDQRVLRTWAPVRSR